MKQTIFNRCDYNALDDSGFSDVFSAVVTNDGKIVANSTNLCKLFGVSLEHVKNGNILDFVSCKDTQLLQQKLSHSHEWQNDVTFNNFFGHEIYTRVYSKPINEYMSKVLIVDVTDLRLELLKATHLSYHDYMTNLGNRRLFDKLFRELFQQEKKGLTHLVLSLDVNGLKKINDKYGHEVGNNVIIELSNRLRSHCMTLPKTHAFRVGGDEFIVLASVESFDTNAQQTMRDLHRNLYHSQTTSNAHFDVCVSAGLLVFKSYGLNSEDDLINNEEITTLRSTIMTEVDEALYMAKRSHSEDIVICSSHDA